MKKIFYLTITSLYIVSCSPSQEELDEQQRIQDSIHNIERETVIDKTNSYFNSDTVRTNKSDTLK